MNFSSFDTTGERIVEGGEDNGGFKSLFLEEERRSVLGSDWNEAAGPPAHLASDAQILRTASAGASSFTAFNKALYHDSNRLIKLLRTSRQVRLDQVTDEAGLLEGLRCLREELKAREDSATQKHFLQQDTLRLKKATDTYTHLLLANRKASLLDGKPLWSESYRYERTSRNSWEVHRAREGGSGEDSEGREPREGSLSRLNPEKDAPRSPLQLEIPTQGSSLRVSNPPSAAASSVHLSPGQKSRLAALRERLACRHAPKDEKKTAEHDVDVLLDVEAWRRRLDKLREDYSWRKSQVNQTNVENEEKRMGGASGRPLVDRLLEDGSVPVSGAAQANKTHFHPEAVSKKPMPFVVGKSTGASHSLPVNLQRVLALMKASDPVMHETWLRLGPEADAGELLAAFRNRLRGSLRHMEAGILRYLQKYDDLSKRLEGTSNRSERRLLEGERSELAAEIEKKHEAAHRCWLHYRQLMNVLDEKLSGKPRCQVLTSRVVRRPQFERIRLPTASSLLKSTQGVKQGHLASSLDKIQKPSQLRQLKILQTALSFP